jgi:Mn-dependent DtxR family transcriptional regulator
MTEWIDTENAVLCIPYEESSKNSENWVVSLRDDTADVLAEWLKERSYKPMYDDTNTL